jgi:hypothetical protein
MPSQDETERRQTRRGTLTLDQALDAFERSRGEHVLGAPSTEEELRRLERAVGAALPASFRRFLAQIGGGLFFRGHEIFGTRRVMIHDIELVPDILSLRDALAAQGTTLPARTIPIHRARGLIHVMRLDPDAAGQIESVPPSAPSPSLERFLEIVVLPRLPSGAGGGPPSSPPA